jgi:hypothetical protein
MIMTNGKLFGLALLGSASLITVTAIAEPVADGGRKFTTIMTGANEVPGPGDPDGTGTAKIVVNPGQKRLCFALAVTNIVPATAAHVHRAPVGVAGPVIVPLDAPSDGDSAGCRDITRALAVEIIQHPERFYVNVHNADFPAGAIRGQLGK